MDVYHHATVLDAHQGADDHPDVDSVTHGGHDRFGRADVAGVTVAGLI